MIKKLASEIVEMLRDVLSYFFYERDPGFPEDLLEVLFEDDESHYETKTIHGQVTSVRENQNLAIIDGDVYMDLSIPVPGGKKLRLKDNVIAIVKRRSEDDAWRVDRIEMVDRAHILQNDSDKNEEEPLCQWTQTCQYVSNTDTIEHFKHKSVVAQVTGVSDELLVNHGEFKLPLNNIDGITYAVGDWLNLKILFDPEEPNQKLICTSIEPLRKWMLEGRINILQDSNGVIDDDIYFDYAVCMNGYKPVLKDFVRVTAIESNAGGEEFMWRAISIHPCTKNFRNVHIIPSVQTYKDIREISVERESDFGNMEVGTEKELRIKVTNKDAYEHTMIDVKFLNKQTNFEIRNLTVPVKVPAEESITIDTFFKASTMGKFEDVLELDFGKFIVQRSVSAHVHMKENSPSPHSFLARFKQSKSSSVRQVLEDQDNRDSKWVMKGIRPYKPPPFTSLRLASYPVPRSLWQTIQQKSNLLASNPSLGDILGPKTYWTKFQTLLHLEEIETTLRLREYDISRSSLKPVGPYLSLEVKGLAEKRPSLVPGDGVLLSNPWGGSGLSYEGFVHATLKTEVLIQFHPDFHKNYDGEDYAVRFLFNRTPMRRYHTAIEASGKHPGFKYLFPCNLEKRPPQIVVSQQSEGNTSNVIPVHWVNPSLNQEQRRAVLRILEGVYRPMPYIIYGPPGTGKTVTVVEAVLQTFLLHPRSRILVATPSNSSADLIAHRLQESGRVCVGDMVRLHAYNRKTDSIPESIQPYSLICEDMLKAVRHRILVTTCTTSGKVYTMCLQIGHFTHLFIDEAGQATEPESLVSIGLIRCDSNPGQIVLAGDPKQLGPVLLSRQASDYGLGVSLLERLSTCPLYCRQDRFADCGHYNPDLLTKLVRNYRSHSSLLTLPSLMFYDNELVACATTEVSERMAHFSWLPKPGVPLLFHGVRGENYQEVDSPSWCNPAEVYHVIRYLQLLLNAKVDPENVGVITPYRKQVEKIRHFIRSNDLFPFKVGSVEEFQGQERDVIIVSTVRSHESYVEQDVIQHLGFIRSPKRFNVTVTRARSLMIVIGNPHLLIHDEHWGPFLKHCAQLGAYTGCDLPEM